MSKKNRNERREQKMRSESSPTEHLFYDATVNLDGSIRSMRQWSTALLGAAEMETFAGIVGQEHAFVDLTPLVPGQGPMPSLLWTRRDGYVAATFFEPCYGASVPVTVSTLVVEDSDAAAQGLSNLAQMHPLSPYGEQNPALWKPGIGDVAHCPRRPLIASLPVMASLYLPLIAAMETSLAAAFFAYEGVGAEGSERWDHLKVGA